MAFVTCTLINVIMWGREGSRHIGILNRTVQYNNTLNCVGFIEMYIYILILVLTKTTL